jgi:hypothetical protein
LATSLRGEQLDGDDDGRCQINKRPENPHQRSSKDLIFDRGHAEKIGHGGIRRIENAISEAKKCTQCTAGHHSKKQIQWKPPAGPNRLAGERLNHGPPKQNGYGQETYMFDFVPELRFQSEAKGRRNVPADQGYSCGNPAHPWV